MFFTWTQLFKLWNLQLSWPPWSYPTIPIQALYPVWRRQVLSWPPWSYTTIPIQALYPVWRGRCWADPPDLIPLFLYRLCIQCGGGGCWADPQQVQVPTVPVRHLAQQGQLPTQVPQGVLLQAPPQREGRAIAAHLCKYIFSTCHTFAAKNWRDASIQSTSCLCP